ncbi:hypothetical protein MIFL109517_10030 [Micrococcus flavus]
MGLPGAVAGVEEDGARSGRRTVPGVRAASCAARPTSESHGRTMSAGMRAVRMPASAGAMAAWSTSSSALPSGSNARASHTRAFSTRSGCSTAEVRRSCTIAGSVVMRSRTSLRKSSQPRSVNRSRVEATRSSRAEYQTVCTAETERSPRRSVARRRVAAASVPATARRGWMSRTGSAARSVSRS